MTEKQLKIIVEYMNDCIYEVMMEGAVIWPLNLNLYIKDGRIYDQDGNPFYTTEEVIINNRRICPVCGQYAHVQATVMDNVEVGVLNGALALSGQYQNISMTTDRRFIQSVAWWNSGGGICPFHGAEMVPYYKVQEVLGEESYIITNLTGFPSKDKVMLAIEEIATLPFDDSYTGCFDWDDEKSIKEGLMEYYMERIYYLAEFIEYYGLEEAAETCAASLVEESYMEYMENTQWTEE